MAKKAAPVPLPLRDRYAFDHLSKEERFLLFVAGALGSSRAAKCFSLDTEKAEVAWGEFSDEPLPINLS